MRFEKGHKAATRQHILEVASKSFRRDGVSAAGIAGIMGEAGLTNGAFYPHFASKEVLVREALASALADQQHRLEEDQQTGMDLEGAIRRYLNRAHLEDPACGCPSAALLPETSLPMSGPTEVKTMMPVVDKGYPRYNQLSLDPSGVSLPVSLSYSPSK